MTEREKKEVLKAIKELREMMERNFDRMAIEFSRMTIKDLQNRVEGIERKVGLSQ